MNTELKGPTVIRRKLRAKRVGELQIDTALAQFTSERQLENATKLAQKLFRRYAKHPVRRQKEKVYQGLITQGQLLISRTSLITRERKFGTAMLAGRVGMS